jgi:hypothetical protein
VSVDSVKRAPHVVRWLKGQELEQQYSKLSMEKMEHFFWKLLGEAKIMLVPGKKFVLEEQGIAKAIDATGGCTDYLDLFVYQLTEAESRDDIVHENEKKIERDSLLCAISSKAAVLFCQDITNILIAEVADIMINDDVSGKKLTR